MSEAGKPSRQPKHGQVQKISTCLRLCTAQHSPATSRQLNPGSFWGQHRLGDTASSAHFSNRSRKLLGSTCFLLPFSTPFTSLSTLYVRLPLVSASKALPLWETWLHRASAVGSEAPTYVLAEYWPCCHQGRMARRISATTDSQQASKWERLK